MEVIDQLLQNAGEITAIRARKEDNDKWAIEPDDFEKVKKWILDGTLKIAVKTGIIKFGSPEEAYPDILPQELHNCLVYYVIAEWYDAIGEVEESMVWRNKHERELKRYRVTPLKNTNITIPYNAI